MTVRDEMAKVFAADPLSSVVSAATTGFCLGQAEARNRIVAWLRKRCESGPPNYRERIALYEAAEMIEQGLDT